MDTSIISDTVEPALQEMVSRRRAEQHMELEARLGMTTRPHADFDPDFTSVRFVNHVREAVEASAKLQPKYWSRYSEQSTRAYYANHLRVDDISRKFPPDAKHAKRSVTKHLRQLIRKRRETDLTLDAVYKDTNRRHPLGLRWSLSKEEPVKASEEGVLETVIGKPDAVQLIQKHVFMCTIPHPCELVDARMDQKRAESSDRETRRSHQLRRRLLPHEMTARFEISKRSGLAPDKHACTKTNATYMIEIEFDLPLREPSIREDDVLERWVVHRLTRVVSDFAQSIVGRIQHSWPHLSIQNLVSSNPHSTC